MVWNGDGSVSFRANNGKLVATKRSGHLYANTDTVDDTSKYFFYLVNRSVSRHPTNPHTYHYELVTK